MKERYVGYVINSIDYKENDSLLSVLCEDGVICLRARGVKKLKVVYSSEPTVAKKLESDEQSIKRLPPSAIFVPASAGLLIASQVVDDLIKGE